MSTRYCAEKYYLSWKWLFFNGFDRLSMPFNFVLSARTVEPTSRELRSSNAKLLLSLPFVFVANTVYTCVRPFSKELYP